MAEIINRDNFESKVLFNDGRTLVYDKPSGYETIVKGGGNSKFCLTSTLRRLFGREIFPCHRLDRDTSGCQLFTFNQKSLVHYEELFKNQKINKIYLAISTGIPSQKKGTINHPLSPWKGGKNPVEILTGKEPESLPAKTSYRIITTGTIKNKSQSIPLGLLSFKLFTGRTHQIRVHSRSVGAPLLGDDQYGEREINKIAKNSCGLDRQALHAWKLSFNLPEENKNITTEAPMPEDMTDALDLFFKDWKRSLFG